MPAFDLSSLEHVIVLMMENRSFDHMVGSLSLVEGRPVNGLQPGFSNPDKDGVEHKVAPLRGTPRVSRFAPDVPHDSNSVALQMSGPMRGFIKAYQAAGAATGLTITAPEQVLGYYTRQELPISYFFADEFTLCERWFTPIPTGTIPNRLYSLCGHSKSYRDNPQFNPFIDIVPIFDKLGEDWCVYAGSLPMILMIGSVAKHFQNANNIRKLDDFRRDVRQGRLPSVVWIEPVYDFAAHIPGLPFGPPNDDHPPDAIELGQQLLAEVYGALVAVPQVWEKSVLVVTYDEHGGFFDHVEPPPIPAGEVQADGFRTYGPRLPAFLISPFAERGGVWSDRMDHCSILKMICDWRRIPYLTRRVASTAIRSVADALTATRRTDRPAAPPAPQRFTALAAGPPPPLSDLGHQMEGLRLALCEEYPEPFGRLFPDLMAAPPIPREGQRPTGEAGLQTAPALAPPTTTPSKGQARRPRKAGARKTRPRKRKGAAKPSSRAKKSSSRPRKR